MFAGAAVSVTPDSNDTDGIQSFTASDAATGTTTTITLTGLTTAQDAGLFNYNSINTVFGAGTITVPSITYNTVSVTASGYNYDNSAVNTTYNVTSGS